ncbi:MAG: hypothetical protein EBU90_18185 [Proteobacteria bacterium]|nr:hypothetical protein [Pseudomonadota bacterium]
MSTTDYVVIVKLITGESLIAVIVDDNGKAIKIEHPFLITCNQEYDSYNLAQYCPFSPDSLYLILYDKIISVSSAEEDIANKYIAILDQHFAEEQEEQEIKTAVEITKTLDKLESMLDTVSIKSNKDSIWIKGTDTIQ